MNTAIDVLASVSLVWMLLKVHQLRRWTASTTADSCRRWAMAGIIVCLTSRIFQLPGINIPLQWQSATQYLAAIMLLSPAIGILGARRPGFHAWPWFVILPMVVVLQWPSVSELLAGPSDSAIQVPTPTFVGFVLVLVMGFGNYFGTINTLPALISGLAVFLIGVPVTEFISFDNTLCFSVGCLLMSFSVTLLPGRYFDAPTIPPADNDNVTALWIDFRDLYGIVWAKRIMDRVNQFAAREDWMVRLTLDGFTGADASVIQTTFSDSEGTRQTEVLCWVLKRFVDPPFLNRYLSSTAQS